MINTAQKLSLEYLVKVYTVVLFRGISIRFINDSNLPKTRFELRFGRSRPFWIQNKTQIQTNPNFLIVCQKLNEM